MVSGREASGAVGTFFLSAAMVLVLWRLANALRASPATAWPPHKLFHLLLLLQLTFELPSWLDYAEAEDPSKAEYALHMYSLFALTAGLSLVAVAWRHVINPHASALHRTLLLALNCWYLGLTAVATVRVIRHPGSVRDWVNEDPLFDALILGSVLSNLLLCASVAGYALVKQRAVRRGSQPARVLFRISSCMLGCCACFLLRAALIAKVLTGVDVDETVSERMTAVEFWVCAELLPTAIPVVCTMHLMGLREVAHGPKTSTAGAQLAERLLG